jgi:hypothetical protein
MTKPERWGADDKLIICWSVRLAETHHPLSAIVQCEGCGCDVWAGPASVEKSKEAGWHLICRECAQTLVSAGAELQVGGRYNPGGPIPWEK